MLPSGRAVSCVVLLGGAVLILCPPVARALADGHAIVLRPTDQPENTGGRLPSLTTDDHAAENNGGLPNLSIAAIYISKSDGQITEPVVGHRFWVRVEFSYANPICTPFAVRRTVNGFTSMAPEVNWGCGEGGGYYWHNWGSWLMHKGGTYRITATVDAANAIAESDENDNTLSVEFAFGGTITPEWDLVKVDEGRTLLGDGTDVVVGTMDDAFDFQHPWLSGEDSLGRPRLIAASQNALGPGGSPVNQVHSTALMGIVLARGANDGDLTGFAPDARYVAAEFINRQNVPGLPVLHAFDAAGFLVDRGAEVINMSWSWWEGTDFSSQAGETSLTNLMADYLSYGRNIVCVAAVNQLDDFSRPTAPGSSRNVITVGGLHADLVHAWPWQDHGPTLDGRSKPDLLGNDAENAVAMDPAWRDGFPAAEGWWGTSFAAPFVTGAVAQMLDYGKHHGESVDHRVIKAILMNSGVKTVDFDGEPWSNTESMPLDDEQGTGILNMVGVHQMYSGGAQPPGTVAVPGYDFATVFGAVSQAAGRNRYRLGTPIAERAALDVTMVWDRHTFWADTNGSGGIDQDDYFYTRTDDKQDNLDLVLQRDGVEVAASRSTVDTVEHLHVANLPRGSYELAVERLLAADSGSDEEYGLAWISPADWTYPDPDADSDVDLRDIAGLYACLGEVLPPCVGLFDFDGSQAVNISDFALMQIALSGPR